MRKKKVLKSVLAMSAAAIISVSAVSSYNGGYATKESYMTQLSEIEKEQSEVNSKLSSADSELEREKNNLASIDKDYADVRSRIEKAQAESQDLEKRIAETDKKMTEIQDEITTKTAQIKTETADFMQRIRAMYIAGGSDSYMNVLAESSDFYDVLMRLELMKRVADHDNAQLDDLVEQKKKLEDLEKEYAEQQAELKESMDKYIDLLKTLEEQRSKLSAMQTKSGKTIGELETQKQTLQSRSYELEQKHSEVSSLAETTTTTTTTTTTSTTTTTTPAYRPPLTTTTTGGYAQTTRKTSAYVPPVTTTQPTQPVNPSTNQAKIDKVVAYAKSNVGGAYVFAGSKFRATDCSGLTMLAYAQVGISLPHYAQSQAAYGRSVSYNQMKPGDLIFYGTAYNIYHVSMYVGNGMIVHAECTATGIVISYASKNAGNIYCIKRLIET